MNDLSPDRANALACQILSGVRTAAVLAERTGRAQAFDLLPDGTGGANVEAAMDPFPGMTRAHVFRPGDPAGEDDLVGLCKLLYSRWTAGGSIPDATLRALDAAHWTRKGELKQETDHAIVSHLTAGPNPHAGKSEAFRAAVEAAEIKVGKRKQGCRQPEAIETPGIDQDAAPGRAGGIPGPMPADTLSDPLGALIDALAPEPDEPPSDHPHDKPLPSPSLLRCTYCGRVSTDLRLTGSVCGDAVGMPAVPCPGVLLPCMAAGDKPAPVKLPRKPRGGPVVGQDSLFGDEQWDE